MAPQTSGQRRRRDAPVPLSVHRLITVAGIDVPRAAITRLALILNAADEQAVAHHLGLAVDMNRDKITLTDAEREAILLALLDDSSEDLAPLRGVLLRDHGRRL